MSYSTQHAFQLPENAKTSGMREQEPQWPGVRWLSVICHSKSLMTEVWPAKVCQTQGVLILKMYMSCLRVSMCARKARWTSFQLFRPDSVTVVSYVRALQPKALSFMSRQDWLGGPNRLLWMSQWADCSWSSGYDSILNLCYCPVLL